MGNKPTVQEDAKDVNLSSFYTIDTSDPDLPMTRILHKSHIPMEPSYTRVSERIRSRYILTMYLVDLMEQVNEMIDRPHLIGTYEKYLDNLFDTDLVLHATRTLSALMGVAFDPQESTFQELLRTAPKDQTTLLRMLRRNVDEVNQVYDSLGKEIDQLNVLYGRTIARDRSPPRTITRHTERVRESRNTRYAGRTYGTERINEVGLKFSDELTVKKLSGPMSLRLMKSGEPTMPIVMLLGDRHFSYDEMCQQCDEKNGCYDLRAPQFFQLLDQTPYADQTSVFVEYSDRDLERADDGTYHSMFLDGFEGGVMYDMIQNALPCVRPKARRTVEKECFTQRLQWHMTDVRYGLRQEPSVEFAMALFKNIGIPSSIQHASKAFKEVVRTIVNTVYDHKTKRITIDRFAETFAKEVLRPENQAFSLIVKQIQKQSYIRMTPAKLKDMLQQGIVMHTARKRWNESELENLFSALHERDLQLGDVFFDPEFWEVFPQRINYFVPFQAALLDVYTVFRMLKSTTDAKLAIAYLGNAHTETIASLLHIYFGYSSLYTSSSQPIQGSVGGPTRSQPVARCVVIQDGIDVGKLVMEVRSKRVSFGHSKPRKVSIKKVIRKSMRKIRRKK